MNDYWVQLCSKLDVLSTYDDILKVLIHSQLGPTAINEEKFKKFCDFIIFYIDSHTGKPRTYKKCCELMGVIEEYQKDTNIPIQLDRYQKVLRKMAEIIKDTNESPYESEVNETKS